MHFPTILVALVIAVSGAAPAKAKSFFCAVDDAWMKLAITGFFDDAAGRKLLDVNGVLAFKGAVMPSQPQGYRLAFNLLTDSSMDDNLMKLRFQAVYPSSDRSAPSTRMDLAVTSQAEDETAGRGLYAMKVGVAQLEPVGIDDPQEHFGSVFCRYE